MLRIPSRFPSSFRPLHRCRKKSRRCAWIPPSPFPRETPIRSPFSAAQPPNSRIFLFPSPWKLRRVDKPPGIDQSSELLVVPAGDKFLRWHGHIGRSYFVQVSDTSNPLAKWTWAPIIESGNDEEISYEVDGTADKGFFRLKHTDQLAGPHNETLETADFDGDGLSNIDEISPPPLTTAGTATNALDGPASLQSPQSGSLGMTANSATDPLNADTDGDGMNDGFERTHGFDPNDADENDNNLPDGADDRDGDGSSNADEAGAGSDPDDPNDTPAGAWHTVTGDNPVDEPKTATKTYTIK